MHNKLIAIGGIVGALAITACDLDVPDLNNPGIDDLREHQLHDGERVHDALRQKVVARPDLCDAPDAGELLNDLRDLFYDVFYDDTHEALRIGPMLASPNEPSVKGL